MFYLIANNAIGDRADYKFSRDCLELKGLLLADFQANQDKYKVKNGQLKNIYNTLEYKDKISQVENQTKIINLQSQIDDLDKKRVRAICEPEIKDKKTGQTWLEFYTLQIQDYREQLEKLKQNGKDYATN